VVLKETSWSCVTDATGSSAVRAFRGCHDKRPSWASVRAASAAWAQDARQEASDLAAALHASYRSAVTTLGVTPISGVGFDVTLNGSHAVVDVTGNAPAPPVAGELGDEVTHWLTATAFSDASVTSVAFTFNGDCTAYGVATGGDACVGTIDRAHFAETLSYEVVR
jgi:hypothetical protein